MTKPKNIDELRDHALETLQKLVKKQISIEEAGVTGKLYESVVSTLKIQIDYAKAIDQKPNIKFLGTGQTYIHELYGKRKALAHGN
jgi:hypothetical protein